MTISHSGSMGSQSMLIIGIDPWYQNTIISGARYRHMRLDLVRVTRGEKWQCAHINSVPESVHFILGLPQPDVPFYWAEIRRQFEETESVCLTPDEIVPLRTK